MSRFGSNPFCSAPYMTAPQSLRGIWPVRYTADQILHAYREVESYHFSITAVQDPLDALLDIGDAMAVISGFGLAGLGIALSPILASAAQRILVTGDMTRRTDPEKCTGVRFVYNSNLCYIEIDFGEAVREVLGSGNSQGNYFYRPRIVLIFYASGYVFANDLTLLSGAGVILGGIDMPGTSGVITDIFAVGGDGPPIGEPSVFGEIKEKDLLAQPIC